VADVAHLQGRGGEGTVGLGMGGPARASPATDRAATQVPLTTRLEMVRLIMNLCPVLHR
jgi:hypothetical protein